jgi:hypothetical protein
MGIGGHQQVETHSTCRHHLFPFRDFEMRSSRADDRDNDRRASQSRVFDRDHFLRKIRFRRKRHLRKFCADAGTLFAAIDNETPGSELAMIRNARGKLQHLLDFRLFRSRLAHLKGGDRASGGQIIKQADFSFHRGPFPLLC